LDERQYTSWDRARLSVVVPAGVIVAVAIVCIVVAVLSSAHRADDMSIEQERQLFSRALSSRGARVLREVESVTTSETATRNIRTQFDAGWVDQRVGLWLQNFFEHDAVLVIDGNDRLAYSVIGRRVADPAWFAAAQPGLNPMIDYLRGRGMALAGATKAGAQSG
jgi:sensor domain CHASE-containing protein